MKVTVNIDCTPEEARAFFGLPDLQPLQRAWIERMIGLMTDATPADLESLTRRWAEGWPGMSEAMDRWLRSWALAPGPGGKPPAS